MGMTGAAVAGWQSRHDELLDAQARLGARSARLGALSRMLRQGLQLAMLASGAWLVIAAGASAGIMVAATILIGRALQPLEHLISGWKAQLDARGAWQRLSEPGLRSQFRFADLQLPAPTGRLEVEGVVFGTAPGAGADQGSALRARRGREPRPDRDRAPRARPR